MISFSRVLDQPEDFFHLPDQIKGFASNCVYHRKRQSTPETVLRRLLAVVNIRRIQIKRLLRATEINVANQFHRFDIGEHGDNPAALAQLLRAAWQLPPGPIPNLMRTIEDAGGIVIPFDFGTSKVDALSQWVPEMMPMFFVNISLPADRVRYSLAHEIGHLVMHQIPNDDMERQADEFAAEFLMPAKQVKRDLVDISLPRLATLKPIWRTSMATLLRRAGDLDLVNERRRAYLWTQMGKAGYRSIEPVPIPGESPCLLEELVELHRSSLGYSVEELKSLIVSNDTDLKSVYLPPTHRLRVVS